MNLYSTVSLPSVARRCSAFLYRCGYAVRVDMPYYTCMYLYNSEVGKQLLLRYKHCNKKGSLVKGYVVVIEKEERGV